MWVLKVEDTEGYETVCGVFESKELAKAVVPYLTWQPRPYGSASPVEEVAYDVSNTHYNIWKIVSIKLNEYWKPIY